MENKKKEKNWIRRKKRKSIIALCVIFGVTAVLIVVYFALMFRPFEYSGEHVDLYTVAINSMFASVGYASNGEARYDSIIEIIEKDQYGRTLFYYDEEDDNYAILIMQKSSDGFAYFYEDLCYETYKVEDRYAFYNDPPDFATMDFSILKERNDWNKEIDEEKCVKKPFVRNNKGALDIPPKTFDTIIQPYAASMGYKGDDTIYRFDQYNTSDAYGREIYYVYGIGRDVFGDGVSPDSTAQYFEFAIIFNPDGSYNQTTCITEIKDTVHFREELIAFKQLNQWNQPYTP